MFRKNKPILPPFVVQVLTTEYLIEGTTQGDVDTDLFRGLMPGALSADSVQITPTGPAKVPAAAPAGLYGQRQQRSGTRASCRVQPDG